MKRKPSILFFILLLCNLVVDAQTKTITKTDNMENVISMVPDREQLSKLNAQFIQNFLAQDVAAHSRIIHKDFVCIESNGAIVSREVYLQNWATDFDNSGYTSFTYQDESIRIFGNTAFVRAKTVYTKDNNGKTETGYTIYTDTYVKENGRWQCVQVQITPVK
jgi:ketosteroid isomerase-like protein